MYEVATVFFGNSWESNPDAKEFTLDIIRDMKRRVEEWSDQYGYHFSIYSTPSESLTDRFCRLDTDKFGSIPDITDKEYYTNSFHYDVRKNPTPFENWILRKSIQKQVRRVVSSIIVSIQSFSKIQRPWKLSGTMPMTVWAILGPIHQLTVATSVTLKGILNQLREDLLVLTVAIATLKQ